MQSDDGERNKGAGLPSGKILKGTLNEAPLKVKVSSIPTRFENIVYVNHGQSAFGNSQRRFFSPGEEDLSCAVGPGKYHADVQFGNVDSKRGSGSFASLTKLARLERVKSDIPGPGTYQIEAKPIVARLKSKSTTALSARLPGHDLFKEVLSTKKDIPGPGVYDQPQRSLAKQPSTMFKSEVARFPTDKDNNPAVGSYRWSETATYRPRTLRFGAEKEESVRKQAEYIEKLIGKKLPSSIGPGSYEVAFKPFGRTFEMRPEPKARLEEPSKPVLVQSIEMTKTNPKMGQTHSVFKSKTKRYSFGEESRKLLCDPCKYSPVGPTKKQHLVNFANNWV